MSNTLRGFPAIARGINVREDGATMSNLHQQFDYSSIGKYRYQRFKVVFAILSTDHFRVQTPAQRTAHYYRTHIRQRIRWQPTDRPLDAIVFARMRRLPPEGRDARRRELKAPNLERVFSVGFSAVSTSVILASCSRVSRVKSYFSKRTVYTFAVVSTF